MRQNGFSLNAFNRRLVVWNEMITSAKIYWGLYNVVNLILVEVCDAEEILNFESQYKDLPEAVACSIANCRTPHKKGYIALLRSGERARIGHICGKRLLGNSVFGQMQRDLDARQERERRERIITCPTFNPGAALDTLEAWKKRLAAMGQFVQELDSVEHGIVSDLRDAATKHDGRLTTYGGTVIHVLRGAGWLRTNDTVRYFSDAKSSIRCSVNFLKKERLTDQELEKVVNEAGRAARLLRIVADAIDAFDAFCHQANIVGIARWLNATIEVNVCGPSRSRLW
jgi:hypothetical protein